MRLVWVLPSRGWHGHPADSKLQHLAGSWKSTEGDFWNSRQPALNVSPLPCRNIWLDIPVCPLPSGSVTTKLLWPVCSYLGWQHTQWLKARFWAPIWGRFEACRHWLFVPLCKHQMYLIFIILEWTDWWNLLYMTVSTAHMQSIQVSPAPPDFQTICTI